MNAMIPTRGDAVHLRRGRLGQLERVAQLAQAGVGGHALAPAADARVRGLELAPRPAATAGRITSPALHRLPALDASTSASTSAVVRARTIAPSAPAAGPALASRGGLADPLRVGDVGSSLSHSPWKPTRTSWSSRSPALPPRATPGTSAGSPRSCRRRHSSRRRSGRQASPAARLAADDDPRRRVRAPGYAVAPSSGYRSDARLTGPPVHSARIVATASSRWCTRSGGSGKGMP